MRILYFSRSYTAHDQRFLTALARTAHRVYWMRLEGGQNRGAAPNIPDGIEPVEWFAGHESSRWQEGWQLMRAFQDTMMKVKPDLVHAGPIQSCAFLAALAGTHPLVSMSWGSDLLVDSDRDMLWRWATQFTLQRSQVLIADCQTVKKKAEGFGYPAERIVVFPWGVDLKRFSPTPPTKTLTGKAAGIRKRYRWENRFVMLCMRSWEPLYGVDLIARAFVQAARQNDNLRLILVGGGSQELEIHRILNEGGVHDRVAFPGRLKQGELPAYYRAADLYLSASHSDGSSVSLLEALACGKPVLVSDIPANREWITAGEQGWFFPDGEYEALAQAILNSAGQTGMLPAMGQAARATAVAKADWTINFQGLLRAYELAMGISQPSAISTPPGGELIDPGSVPYRGDHDQ